MKVLIMGAGRTGALLASMLCDAHHDVTLIDWSQSALGRVPREFQGDTVHGNAMDYDVLRRAGIENADAFVAATSGDNRNIMAGEIAKNVFHVPKVVARVKDPSRARFFYQLGLEVDCRTTFGTRMLREIVEDYASQHAS